MSVVNLAVRQRLLEFLHASSRDVLADEQIQNLEVVQPREML